jgi:arylsulfatase A-like enzyme
MLFLYSGAVRTAPLCGAPTFDSSVEATLFLWQDCDTQTWQTRVSAGGGKATYAGSVSSDEAFTSVSGFSVESSDTLDWMSDPGQIDFRLTVYKSSLDGFSFDLPAGAGGCFTLDAPSGASVLVGPSRVPVVPPFRMDTLESCDNGVSPDGAPSYNPAIEAGLFLWRDASHEWHLRSTAGGARTTYSGLLDADSGFINTTLVSIESTDTVDLSDPSRIAFTLKVYNKYQDGIDFTYAAGDDVCLNLNSTPATVLVGADKTPVTTPFSLSDFSSCGTSPPPPPPPPGGKPNFVVFLTDDQHPESMWAMPIVREKLGSRGVTFTNAYVFNSKCCPARVSLLSGGYYGFNTGVLMNPTKEDEDNGGVEIFNDRDTLGTNLQAAGYKTAFVGKYLNFYPSHAPSLTYIPPGWTRFVGNKITATQPDWSHFSFVEGSSTANRPGKGSIVNANGKYLTYYHRDAVLDFLDTVGDKPFVAIFSTNAPHADAVPAPGDQNLFSNYVYTGRGYGETDLSDKPVWVANPARWTSVKKPNNKFMRDQLRSLQAVDRAVGAIVDKVERLGKLDNTIFIFTSDNGMLWGEHGLFFVKANPYNEAIGVPFIIVKPGVAPRTDDSLIYADIDIGATLYHLAGINENVDGRSLVPLLDRPSATWRTEMINQSWGYRTGPSGGWSVLRNERWKYIKHISGEQELYDMVNDPYELESKHASPARQTLLNTMRTRLESLEGLQITTVNIAAGKVGVPYSFRMKAWGGKKPYAWNVLNQSSTGDVVTACAEGRKLVPPIRLDLLSSCSNGAPPYDPAVDKGMFLWPEGGGKWKLRATAGGTSARYHANIETTPAFTNVQPVSLELSGDDELDTSLPNRIHMDLHINGEGFDGIDFATPSRAFLRFVFTDDLPNGLALNPETGLISGIPTKAGTYNLKIMVQGSSMATHVGRLQQFIVPLKLVINR